MDALPSLTTEIMLVLGLVVLAVVLFSKEYLRVDVTALLVMTLLGLVVYIPGFDGLLDPSVLFSGLSSNAVVSIIAVMILGGGLDKTGVMERVAWVIMRIGSQTESKIVMLISSTVAFISAFMQNVGATALFLPVVARISSRTGLPMSRLVMPMGFCAILGGTMTMIASSPLIMLNDLLDAANASLSEADQMEHFGLFSVAPVGIALVAAGLAYFILFGRYVLPRGERKVVTRGAGTIRYLRRMHGVDAAVREVEVPIDSPLVGHDIKSVQREFEVRIVASRYAGKVLVAPPIEAPIAAPATLAVIAQHDELKHFIVANGLRLRPKLVEFRHLLARSIAGIAEIIVPPDSTLIGKSVRETRMRMSYGLSLLSIYRGDTSITHKLQDIPFQAGDTLLCHTRWDNLARLESDRDMVIVTSDYPREERKPFKLLLAVGFFALALSMVLFTNILLPIALLTGAVGMIVTGVLTMDEAYSAVSWKTVFLLAGLLPLGHAVESSGAANYIALHTLHVFDGVPTWVLQLMLAVIAAAFTLVISNIGATVILVPIAINIAVATGADPAMFALTVAISTSNSFLIPTHQVNALVMGPGDYRVADFIRAGSAMTILFIVVSLIVLNLIF